MTADRWALKKRTSVIVCHEIIYDKNGNPAMTNQNHDQSNRAADEGSRSEARIPQDY